MPARPEHGIEMKSRDERMKPRTRTRGGAVRHATLVRAHYFARVKTPFLFGIFVIKLAGGAKIEPNVLWKRTPI